MATNATVKVGQTEQLFLTYEPPGSDLSTLAYTASPEGFLVLTPNNPGVAVTGVKPTQQAIRVIASIQGEDDNGNPALLTAECDVQVSRPLVRKLALGPAS